MLKPVTSTSAELLVSDRWLMAVEVYDDNGYLVDEAPTFTVTSPAGVISTPAAQHLEFGKYQAAVTVSEGRYVAVAALAGRGATSFAATASAITTAAQMPDLADVKTYLGETSTTDDVLQDALDAETAAQSRVCKVPAVYPSDLREALLRRVAVNLAKRGIPLAVLQGDAETGSLTIPGRDPEIRRLEGPFRKLVIA